MKTYRVTYVNAYIKRTYIIAAEKVNDALRLAYNDNIGTDLNGNTYAPYLSDFCCYNLDIANYSRQPKIVSQWQG